MRKKGIIRHGRGIIENQNASLLARDKKLLETQSIASIVLSPV
jgi:hypothetical protein